MHEFIPFRNAPHTDFVLVFENGASGLAVATGTLAALAALAAWLWIHRRRKSQQG